MEWNSLDPVAVNFVKITDIIRIKLCFANV